MESRGATAASGEIYPEYVYPGQNQPPRVPGYAAPNSVRVEILRLEQAGGMLRYTGGLIELSAQPSYQRPIAQPMDLKAMFASCGGDVPISPGQLTVSATVTGRWGYTQR